jgi:hypothetical protein
LKMTHRCETVDAPDAQTLSDDVDGECDEGRGEDEFGVCRRQAGEAEEAEGWLGDRYDWKRSRGGE